MPDASPARSSRRMPRPRAALAVLSCALVLATAACASPDGDSPPASTSAPSAPATDEPIFASDEEALAAAVEAYEAYVDVSETITSEGGAEPSRIEAVVSAELASVFIEEFQALQANGLSTTGASKVYSPTLVERVEAEGRASVSAYICRDVSAVRILDKRGVDVTPDGPAISAVLAHFESTPKDSDGLLLKDSELWDDASFCA